MTKAIVSITCAAILSLVGCRTSPVNSAQKAGIKTIMIEPRIDAAQGMRYGANIEGGGVFIGLGTMLMDNAGQKNIARMTGIMQTNGIVIAEMIQTHVASRLRQYPELQLVNEEADGVFVVKILQFGFSPIAPARTNELPFLVLQTELLSPNGKRVWSSSTVDKQWLVKGIGATWNDYEQNPTKLRNDWDKQIEFTVSELFPSSKK